MIRAARKYERLPPRCGIRFFVSGAVRGVDLPKGCQAEPAALEFRRICQGDKSVPVEQIAGCNSHEANPYEYCGIRKHLQRSSERSARVLRHPVSASATDGCSWGLCRGGRRDRHRFRRGLYQKVRGQASSTQSESGLPMQMRRQPLSRSSLGMTKTKSISWIILTMMNSGCGRVTRVTDDKASVLLEVCGSLLDGDVEQAGQILDSEYPFERRESKR